MQKLIDANNLMEYCLNQKDRTIDCNDIARFPPVLALPENPTNGDMIKAVFPNFEEDVTIVGDTILLERYMPYCKMQFHRDWWDAPYKENEDADSN